MKPKTWKFPNSYQLFAIVSLLCHPSPVTPSHVSSQTKMLMTSETLSMHHFKPGVAADALPDAFHYNKYIPLIFKLQVPELSMDTLRLNTSSPCTSDQGDDPLSPLCPVTYHLDRILAPIADSMNFAKNIYAPSEGWTFFGKFSCDRIEPHFFHLAAHTEELRQYTDQLSKICPLASKMVPIRQNLSMDATQHILLASEKFTNLTSSSTTGAYKNLKSKDPSSELNRATQLQMAGYVGFQAIHLLAKYVDTIRWNNAFTQCQSSRLSINLVNSYWLRTALIPVKAQAEEAGYRLALQVHEILPHYYKLPLTDCILGITNTKVQMAKNTTLMIRVLVPVMKKGVKYTRFRLTKIPYLITEGGKKQVCEIQGFDPKDDFLLTETLGVAGGNPIISVAPTCFESELCHVPEQPRSIVVDPCVKGLMNGSVDQIRDYCSFECFPIENEDLLLPIIIKVATNQYSITGAPPNYRPIHVYCDNNLTHVLKPNGSNGVMQVILPCNCEIRFKSEVYQSFRPCDQPYEAHYLNSVPFKVYFHPHPADHDGHDDNPEPAEITRAVLSEKADSRYLDVQEIGENGNDPSAGPFNAGQIQAGDGILPYQIIPASWILSDDKSHAHKLMDKPQPRSKSVRMEDKPAQSSSDKHGGQFAMIWILLILLCGSNGMLIYIVYKNRLIDLGGFRLALSRWGVASSSPPRSRLREEEAVPSGGVAVGVVNANNPNNANNQLNIQDNNSSINRAYIEEWPANLNRL